MNRTGTANYRTKWPVKAGLLVIFFVFVALSPKAEESITASTDLQLQVSTLPEAKLSLNQKFSFPFLRGSGPLTQDNNIALALSAEVTPVSVDGLAELIWTPAAFFMFSGGGLAYSGWNNPLGSGIGINAPIDENAQPPRKAEISGSAFDGLVWNAWGAATLQFDLGAVIPGDWTHVLFQTRQEFRYSAYTRAAQHEPWIFENDDGENMNGWNYRANYVLGYNMPKSPVLDTIAFMAEMKKSLYNSPNGDFWGESLGQWIFSGILNFSIHPRFSTALAVQMYTRRNHGISNFNNKEYFYQDFELSDENGRLRVLFYRAALIMNYKIR
jgi:hypothetical protein